MAAARKSKNKPAVSLVSGPTEVKTRGRVATLITGESEEGYRELLRDVTETVRPRDFIEELWVGDVVYLTWELIRLRRAKITLVNARMQDGLEAVLISIKDPDSAELARLWRARDRHGTDEVEAALKHAGLSMDAAVAETFAMNLDEMERFDRMIMSAEARRDAILREVARHREALGAQLRNKTTEIQDAEFVEASGQPASEAEP